MESSEKENTLEYPEPLVSVCITTYNHENYIKQALDSVLAQEADFDFEILIGEDDSSDNTRAICIEYAEKYPDKIRLFLNDRKNVIYIDEIATGRWNFINNIKHAKGKYVAIIEGDDYWTDKKKLQYQANLLTEKPGCSICFHDAQILFEETNVYCEFSTHLIKSYGHNPLAGGNIIEFGIKEIFEKWMMPTASIMYRRESLDSLPKWFCKIFSGDRAMQLLLADKGQVIYLNRKMCVWRRHSQGLSNYIDGVWLQKNKLNIFHEFNKYKNYKYDELLSIRFAKALEQISYGGEENSINIKVNKSIKPLLISMNYYKRFGVLTPKMMLVMMVKWIFNKPNLRTYKDLFKQQV